MRIMLARALVVAAFTFGLLLMLPALLFVFFVVLCAALAGALTGRTSWRVTAKDGDGNVLIDRSR